MGFPRTFMQPYFDPSKQFEALLEANSKFFDRNGLTELNVALAVFWPPRPFIIQPCILKITWLTYWVLAHGSTNQLAAQSSEFPSDRPIRVRSSGFG